MHFIDVLIDARRCCYPDNKLAGVTTNLTPYDFQSSTLSPVRCLPWCSDMHYKITFKNYPSLYTVRGLEEVTFWNRRIWIMDFTAQCVYRGSDIKQDDAWQALWYLWWRYLTCEIRSCVRMYDVTLDGMDWYFRNSFSNTHPPDLQILGCVPTSTGGTSYGDPFQLGPGPWWYCGEQILSFGPDKLFAYQVSYRGGPVLSRPCGGF